MKKVHSFHIPVMGIGFTIDTPLRVSQFGIDSVISLVDDVILEKLRKMYCEKHEIKYREITDKSENFRAKRITSYLNLINELANKKFDELRDISNNRFSRIKEYLSMLPDNSAIKDEFKKLVKSHLSMQEMSEWIKDKLSMGSIDVNIMTKIDKINFVNKVKLSNEFNDAHTALKGFAESDLDSSIIFSAGLNPKLYSYVEKFRDFFPNELGKIKKRIILKVSDYRSALIQGKFLAKKGIWVSEYRVESGLNCGGHAFATNGYLFGPILAEFRDRRRELHEFIQAIVYKALKNKEMIVPKNDLRMKITAQGGVGTSEEHHFLLEHYKIDSVGWGTPFLLVPEVTNVDEKTFNQLIEAKEKDLYLSDISPLGVPFNSLRGNSKELEKYANIDKGRPGSACPKKYIALGNHDMKDEGLCIASRLYQHLKIKELEKSNIEEPKREKEYNRIIEKSCLCVGLGTSALLTNNLDTKVEGEGVSICPGPNMAYFSKKASLKEMLYHIYGKSSVPVRDDRPNMFIKETNIYINFLKNALKKSKKSLDSKQEKYLLNFAENLANGISYYEDMFKNTKLLLAETKEKIYIALKDCKKDLEKIRLDIDKLIAVPTN